MAVITCRFMDFTRFSKSRICRFFLCSGQGFLG
jgi:hypothetical protein